MRVGVDTPTPGQLVQIRQRRWLVESVERRAGISEATLVRAACVDDDAQGEGVAALWKHELGARFFGATLGDGPRYNIKDGFETFPFPEGFATDPRLRSVGEEYYRFRRFDVTNNEGLTKTYNRFHDPDERSNAIHELRRLHEAMDRAVLDAYCWSEVPTGCTFELGWEEDEENGSGRRRKPWRYRWPEEVRDQVLARLLALNKERAAAEAEARAHLR